MLEKRKTSNSENLVAIDQEFIHSSRDFLHKLAGTKDGDYLTNFLLHTISGIGRLFGYKVGFEALSMNEGNEGTSGAEGNFFLSKELKDKEIHLDTHLRTLIEQSSAFMYTKYRPGKEYDFRKQYLTRESNNPIIRLILPHKSNNSTIDPEVKTSEQCGYIDLPKKIVEILSHHMLTNNVSSLTQLLMTGEWSDRESVEGKAQTAILEGFDVKVKDMTAWFDEKGQKEAIWMILSSGTNDKVEFRDPRALAHFHFRTNLLGLVQEIQTEWGHTGADGERTDGVFNMLGYFDPETRQSKEEFMSHEYLEWASEQRPAVWWNEVEVKPITFSPAWGNTEELSQITSDKLMQTFIEKIGITEVRVSLKMKDDIYNFFKKSGIKYFGKFSHLVCNAVGYVSGQAPLMPVALKDKSSNAGLQVILGPGGEKLHTATKEIVYSVRKNYANMTLNSINPIIKFWNYWDEQKWNETFDQQVKNAQNGRGLVTMMVAGTGSKYRGIVERISGKVKGNIANFLKTRWMVSIMENGKFFTAFNKSAGNVLGFTREGINLRTSMKDPVFVFEAAIKMLEIDRTIFAELVNKMSLDDRRVLCKKYHLKSKSLDTVITWLDGLSSSSAEGNRAAVKDYPFTSMTYWDGNEYKTENMPAMAWPRRVGDSVAVRSETIEHARALTALIVEKNDEEMFKRLKSSISELAKSKLGWIMGLMMELSALGLANEGQFGKFVDVERFASEWIKQVKLNLNNVNMGIKK